MKYLLPSLLVIGLLSGCSTLVDHQTQEVTLRTPGAENAKCIVENEDMKYVVYTDQKVEIMKSPNDLVVRCMAPGNRERTVLVKRELNEWVIANVANGFVPGVAYDYFSRGGFDYPEEISVSFVGVPVQPYDLPQYMSDDLQSEQFIRGEYMGPGQIAVPEGVNKSNLQKRENNFNAAASPPETRKMPLDSIHSRYNPAVSYNAIEEDK